MSILQQVPNSSPQTVRPHSPWIQLGGEGAPPKNLLFQNLKQNITYNIAALCYCCYVMGLQHSKASTPRWVGDWGRQLKLLCRIRYQKTFTFPRWVVSLPGTQGEDEPHGSGRGLRRQWCLTLNLEVDPQPVQCCSLLGSLQFFHKSALRYHPVLALFREVREEEGQRTPPESELKVGEDQENADRQRILGNWR